MAWYCGGLDCILIHSIATQVSSTGAAERLIFLVFVRVFSFY